MLLFHTTPDDANWGKNYKYYVNATHKWGLPGVYVQYVIQLGSMIGVQLSSFKYFIFK
jgi:hypothetical protein